MTQLTADHTYKRSGRVVLTSQEQWSCCRSEHSAHVTMCSAELTEDLTKQGLNSSCCSMMFMSCGMLS